MREKISVSAFLLFASTHLMAVQPVGEKDVDQQLADLSERYGAVVDSLASGFDAGQSSSDTQMNPRLIRLFGKTTFYKSSVKSALKGEDDVELYASSDDQGYLALATDSRLAKHQQIEDAIDQAILEASVMHPEEFEYTEESFDKNVTTVETVEQQVVNNIVPTIIQQEDQQNQAVGVEMEVKKPNFWNTSGETSLTFTQNYISKNWTQGGENTNTLLALLTLKANYNNKQNLTWDNTFEAKLGFTTAPSDTVHSYRTNNDMLRISSKLGLKAFKSWYYTIDLMSKTQFMRNYNVNSNNFTSAFLSPLETTVGIGMDYKKSLKNFNISVNIAPLSYRYLYVSEKAMVASRYGIKNGNRSLQEYGSKITVNSTWKLHTNITWTSHIDAFTSYEKVYANWENTFDFAVSKYLSTKLFMHARFDDGVARKEGYNYFQFKEFLQFGLSYKW